MPVEAPETEPTTTRGGSGTVLVALVAAAVLLAGCVHDGYRTGSYTRATVRYNSPYYYDYHYYPGSRVYFHLYTGRYYYRSGDTWVHARVLPSHIYLGPRDRIHLRIWSDRPYRHWQTHRKRFRAHPDYRRDSRGNSFERRYNRRYHQRYLKRYRR